MEIRKMSDDELRAEIAKKGGYESYRADSLNYNQPVEKREPVQKSAQQLLIDRMAMIAKAQGITIDEYMRKNPQDYELVRQTGYSRDYEK